MHGFRLLCSHFVHIVFAFCSLFVRIRCLLCADFVLTWCLLCAYYGSHWAAGRPGTTFAGQWISPKDVKQTSKNEWHKYKLHEWKQEAQTLIRPRRRSPNAVCHFPQKCKISLKLLSPGLPPPERDGTFLLLFRKKLLTTQMHEFRILCSHFVHIVFAFCSLFVHFRCSLSAH